MPRVLIVDDDRSVLHMVQKSLGADGIEVVTAATPADGLEVIRDSPPDVVLLDIIFPVMSGFDVLEQIQEIDPRLPVILITAGAGSETAIEAVQLGAYDYVAKPLDLPKLRQLVAQAIETRRLWSVPVAVPIGEASSTAGDAFVGRSPQMLEVFKEIGQVAEQNVTVLVRGESGTGKELVARALYQYSDRADQPFMAVNCAALSETLLESELFGHEKGAFTGADRRRIGKFEQCNGGTLFLDEVGDMSSSLQAKVLRVLQEQQFERVGGNETIQTDVRLISATNQNLEQMVDAGEFRADLFYRLNGVTIAIPPLRKRREDVPLLLQHFLTKCRRELDGKDIEGISPEALDVLERYDWPGNVRQLQSVIRRAALKANGPVIVPEFLPDEVRGTRPRGGEVESTDGLPSSDLQKFVESRLVDGSTDLYAETLEMMERFLLTRVLQETGGNQTRAAKLLGITRGKVRERIAAFDISLERIVSLDD